MMIIGGIPMMTITTIGQAQSGRREPSPGTIVQQNRTVQVVNRNPLVQRWRSSNRRGVQRILRV